MYRGEGGGEKNISRMGVPWESGVRTQGWEKEVFCVRRGGVAVEGGGRWEGYKRGAGVQGEVVFAT